MTDFVHRQLRAPQVEGAALIDPPPVQIAATINANRAVASERRCDVHGIGLNDLAATAREGAYRAALAYSREYLDCNLAEPWTSASKFVLAGHQPELFHPGVWFKNFLLSSIASRERAVPINLIVDSDAVQSAAIAVPICGGARGAIENVAIDAPAEATIPFEQRPILDLAQFLSLDDRVRGAVGSCWPGSSQLLVGPLWQAARAAARRHAQRPLLGRVLAEARHAVEAAAGLTTLELPLSLVCQDRPFRWFAVHLLAQLPRLWQTYNRALTEYRLVNHVRSAAHPVPSLEARDEWLEAPLHLWSTADPRRRRPFVRPVAGGLEITDFEAIRLTLPVRDGGSLDDAVAQLAAAESAGIKLRPRALITTMYARLVLSDLFIHGIGGAKYDELTDAIVRRFFGIEPPAFLTATATFRLPIERPQVSRGDLQAAAGQIRAARFRPEALLAHPLVAQDAALAQSLSALAAEKRDYLAGRALRRGSRDAYLGLDQINRAMHALLGEVERELRAEHARLVEQARLSKLLGSREFSFALFSQHDLIPRLLELSKLPA